MRIAASLSFKHSITWGSLGPVSLTARESALATFLDPVFEAMMNERKDRSWEHAGWLVGIDVAVGLAFQSRRFSIKSLPFRMLFMTTFLNNGRQILDRIVRSSEPPIYALARDATYVVHSGLIRQ